MMRKRKHEERTCLSGAAHWRVFPRREWKRIVNTSVSPRWSSILSGQRKFLKSIKQPWRISLTSRGAERRRRKRSKRGRKRKWRERRPRNSERDCRRRTQGRKRSGGGRGRVGRDKLADSAKFCFLSFPQWVDDRWWVSFGVDLRLGLLPEGGRLKFHLFF